MNVNNFFNSISSASTQALMGSAGGAAGGQGEGTSAENKPEDIPKEELMQLCMKMQKRMQAMESKGKELVKKKASLLAERQKLLGIFQASMDIPLLASPTDDQPLDLDAIEHAWSAMTQRKNDQIIDLEQRILQNEQNLQQKLDALRLRHEKELELERSLRTEVAAANSSASKPDTNTNTASTAAAATAPSTTAGVDPLLEPVPATGLVPAVTVIDPAAHSKLQNEAQLLRSKVDTLSREKESIQASMSDYQKRSLKGDAEIQRLRGVESYLQKQLRTIEGVITAKNAELEESHRKLENAASAHEEKVLQLQMQLNGFKSKDEQRQKDSSTQQGHLAQLNAQIASLTRSNEEKDMSVQSNRDMIQSLQVRLIELEPELQHAQDRVKEYERNRAATAMLKAEQEALVESLRNDMKLCIEEKIQTEGQVKDLEAYKMKAEGQLLRLPALSEQINILQASIEDKTSLITRMRTEASTSERNHAMRTAMLATCEAELETLKQKIEDMVKAEVVLKDRVAELEGEVAAVKKMKEEQLAGMSQQLQEEQQFRVKEQQQHSAQMAAEQQRHEEALEAISKDHNKKSSMARTLLSEREEEVRVLSARVQEMQEEISSGAPSERKIFELAQTQSKRDAVHGVHNDTRELAFRQLQSKLAARDYELARMQQGYMEMQNEVTDLRRMNKREGVNMDYLKNIVIQYMCFPNSTSEKLALVPVIAMLLQFTESETKKVHQATALPNAGNLWGARSVKMVVKPPIKPPPSVKKPHTSNGRNSSGAAVGASTGNSSSDGIAHNNHNSSSSSSSSSGGSSSSGNSSIAYTPPPSLPHDYKPNLRTATPDTATMRSISLTATPSIRDPDNTTGAASVEGNVEEEGQHIEKSLSDSAEASTLGVDAAYVQRALDDLPTLSHSGSDIRAGLIQKTNNLTSPVISPSLSNSALDAAAVKYSDDFTV